MSKESDKQFAEAINRFSDVAYFKEALEYFEKTKA